MSPHNRFYFSDGLNVASYDRRAEADLSRFEDYRPFYVAAAVASGGAALELGAGTGRVALAMAAGGVETVGLELAPGMLELARRKWVDVGADIRARLSFVAGDMTDFALGRRFALIAIPFRGFQELLTVHDQKATLRCVREHLSPDGHLVMDLRDPRLEDVLPPADDEPVAMDPLELDDGTILSVHILKRRNNPLTQVLTETWRFRKLDATGQVLRSEEEVHALRWTWRFEMHHLLELCGMTVTAEYADFHGGSSTVGRDQVWIARRANYPGTP
ncbi:MAG: class I SAM-dependent methyltransferase [Alphaproteobacteria bacterium]|nr:class I SAM-dependent methyltransferase [Alphaproteobacteria bacterium]